MSQTDERACDYDPVIAEDEARQAEADAVGKAEPPDWLYASEGDKEVAENYPAAGDEFDVRLHRHELGLLTDLLRALSSGQLGNGPWRLQHSYGVRSEFFQDMLDNPLGGWVERRADPAGVGPLALAVYNTLALAFGPEPAATFTSQLATFGLPPLHEASL